MPFERYDIGATVQLKIDPSSPNYNKTGTIIAYSVSNLLQPQYLIDFGATTESWAWWLCVEV